MSLLALAALAQAAPAAPAAGGLIPPALSRVAEAFGLLAGLLVAAGLVTGTTRRGIRWVVLWACAEDTRTQDARHTELAAKIELLEQAAAGDRREVTRELAHVTELLGECVGELREISKEQRAHGEDIASLLTAANIPRRRSPDSR